MQLSSSMCITWLYQYSLYLVYSLILCCTCTLISLMQWSILASFLSSYQMSSAVTVYVSLLCSIAVWTQALYNLPITLRERLFITNKASSSLNLVQPILILTTMLLEQLPPLLSWSPKKSKLSTNSKEPYWHFRKSIFCTFLVFNVHAHLPHVKTTFSDYFPLIPLHHLCVHSLPWAHHMEFLLILFIYIERNHLYEGICYLCFPTYNFVFVKLTWRPFISKPCFHAQNV